MIDIIFTFRTTYLDPKMGEEVVDPLSIAAEYMSPRIDKVFEGGSFYLDLISSLPLNDLIVTGNVDFDTFLQMLGLLKILRILKLSAFI